MAFAPFLAMIANPLWTSCFATNRVNLSLSLSTAFQ